ncbi:MAG: hypothetical protein IPO67_31340 [Deltaproteobacteria bacterium]|nr:hypothetical protein [Deltaproteobacteria bacterium]
MSIKTATATTTIKTAMVSPLTKTVGTIPATPTPWWARSARLTLTAAQVFPDANETWYDGVDQDCDGQNDYDQDGDGVTVEGDCWDDPNDSTILEEALGAGLTLTAAQVFVGAVDVWYDGVDQDCDGASDFDQDGDGHDSANDAQADSGVGDDCVDGSANDKVFRLLLR